MKLSDILCETTDEDIMLDDLENKIVKHLSKNKSTGTVGTIGSITQDKNFPTKFLNTEIVIRNINGQLGAERHGEFSVDADPNGDHEFAQDREEAIELFYEGSRLIISISPNVINKENTSHIKSTLVHEMRHLLDYIKSEGKDTFSKKSNFTKYLSHGKDKSSKYNEYQSSKSEINARTQQAILSLKEFIDRHTLTQVSTDNLAKLVHKCLDVQEVKKYFPEGTQDIEYRRIFNRLIAYATRYLTVV